MRAAYLLPVQQKVKVIELVVMKPGVSWSAETIVVVVVVVVVVVTVGGGGAVDTKNYL